MFNKISIFKIILFYFTVGISPAQEKLEKISEFPILKGPYLGQKLPGMKPKVFAPGIVTTSIMNHSSPTFSPDGKEIYWSHIFQNPERVQILFTKLKNGKWVSPQVIPFSSQFDDDCPAFSPDGKKLFFTSHRPLEKNGKQGKENIWVTERKEDGWLKPRPLGPPVNSKPLHWQISIGKTGTLYFSDNHDIYRSRLVNDRYNEPEKMRYPINTEDQEYGPFISNNDSYLIFSSDRSEGFGNDDLFISFRKKDGLWSKPKNLGNKINSKSNELLPYVTPDGKYLFFVSSSSGEYDVYWVDAKIIEELQPEELK